MKTYVGIDGGLSGGITALKDDKIIDIIKMPIIKSAKTKSEYDVSEIINFLNKFEDPFVIFEKAHAMPKLGTVQAFNFGKGYGIIIGILSAMKIPFQIVHAKSWQKEMFSDMNKMDTKQASAIIAQRLFPDFDFRPTQRCTKVDSGFTDSALLAVYGSRHF